MIEKGGRCPLFLCAIRAGRYIVSWKLYYLGIPKYLEMTASDIVQQYIAQLCQQLGTTVEKIHNPASNSWFFSRGSATIEVFLTSYNVANGNTRTFVRCFAPIYTIPNDPQQRADLYQGALEANTQYMGVKLSTNLSRGLLYAVAERDVAGMEYEEFVTLVSDLGYWADQMDDFLKTRFGQAGK